MKIEIDDTYKDLRYVVLMTRMGHRCGYVGVSNESILYGKNYQNDIPIRIGDMLNQPVGKRGVLNLLSMLGKDEDDNINIGCFFNVHGGITYSGSGEDDYPVPSSLWWFGYDCGHAGDGRDLSVLDDEEREIFSRSIFPGDVIRTKEYCIEECKSLIDQIKKLEEILK